MASAPKSFGSQLQLNKIPVLGLVPESGATAPLNPVPGQFWLDTSTTPNRLKVYENGSFVLASQTGVELSANKGALNGYAALVAGTVPIAQIPTGTTSSTVALGSDSRLSDPRTPIDGSVTGGTAGSGVKIATGTITDANVAATNKDGAVGVPSMRTIGTGAQQALAGSTTLSTLAAPTTTVNLNGQLISNLATPIASTDAVNKSYADGLRAGLRLKDAVVATTTTNITLTGTQTLDGVAVGVGQRVLVKDQTTASQNGIYVVSSGAWTRDTDADVFTEVQDGATTFVGQGTLYANSTWAQINTLTALTDAQSWVQQGAAASYVAGNGLTLAGATFDVGGTANRITVTADNVDIASTYVGQTSITTLGTITGSSAIWNGTTIALANGGTGATSASAARVNLGAGGATGAVPAKYAADITSALVAGAETLITHNLGTLDVHAMFSRISDGYDEVLSWRKVSTTQIGVTSDIAYNASALRCVVIG